VSLEDRVDELLEAIDPAVTRICWLVLLLAGVVFGGGVAVHVIS
jgi:hypothetical protein